MVNFYQVLGLPFGAPVEEVRKAYRDYAKQFHPDKHNNSQFFTEQFKSIQQAYETLSDEKKRTEYEHEFVSYYGTDNTDEVEKLKGKLNKAKTDNGKLKSDLVAANNLIKQLSTELTKAKVEGSEKKTTDGFAPVKKKFAGSILENALLALFVAAICYGGYWAYNWYYTTHVRLAQEILSIDEMIDKDEYLKAYKRSKELLDGDAELVDGSDKDEQGNKLTRLDLIYTRGVAKLGLEDSIGAMKDFTLVIENGGCSRNYSLYKMRADIKMHMGDTLGGFKDYTASIAEDSTWHVTYYKRGGLLYNKGYYKMAIDDFRSASKLKTGNGDALNMMGGCYKQIGLNDSACAVWRRAGESGSTAAYDNIKNFCL